MSDHRISVNEKTHTVMVTGNETANIGVTEPITRVETGVVGLQGPPGPQGPAGASDARYVHTQSAPSATWVIPHGMGRRPAVLVIDSADEEVEGERTDSLDLNTTTLTFSGAFSGVAYLGG